MKKYWLHDVEWGEIIFVVAKFFTSFGFYRLLYIYEHTHTYIFILRRKRRRLYKVYTIYVCTRIICLYKREQASPFLSYRSEILRTSFSPQEAALFLFIPFFPIRNAHGKGIIAECNVFSCYILICSHFCRFTPLRIKMLCDRHVILFVAKHLNHNLQNTQQNSLILLHCWHFTWVYIIQLSKVTGPFWTRAPFKTFATRYSINP